MRMSTTRRDMSVSALVPGSERLKEAHLYLLVSSSKCCAIELGVMLTQRIMLNQGRPR